VFLWLGGGIERPNRNFTQTMDMKPMIDLDGVVSHHLKSGLVPCYEAEDEKPMEQPNNREPNQYAPQPANGKGARRSYSKCYDR
jgi:hypothetical protein